MEADGCRQCGGGHGRSLFKSISNTKRSRQCLWRPKVADTAGVDMVQERDRAIQYGELWTEEWVNLDQEFTNPRHCFAKGHEAWQIAPGSQSTRALKELPQSSWARIKPLALIRTTVSLRWQRSALHMPLHGRKVCSGVLRAQLRVRVNPCFEEVVARTCWACHASQG